MFVILSHSTDAFETFLPFFFVIHLFICLFFLFLFFLCFYNLFVHLCCIVLLSWAPAACFFACFLFVGY